MECSGFNSLSNPCTAGRWEFVVNTLIDNEPLRAEFTPGNEQNERENCNYPSRHLRLSCRKPEYDERFNAEPIS